MPINYLYSIFINNLNILYLLLLDLIKYNFNNRIVKNICCMHLKNTANIRSNKQYSKKNNIRCNIHLPVE